MLECAEVSHIFLSQVNRSTMKTGKSSRKCLTTLWVLKRLSKSGKWFEAKSLMTKNNFHFIRSPQSVGLFQLEEPTSHEGKKVEADSGLHLWGWCDFHKLNIFKFKGWKDQCWRQVGAAEAHWRREASVKTVERRFPRQGHRFGKFLFIFIRFD